MSSSSLVKYRFEKSDVERADAPNPLVYPDFESDPHPALVRCVRLNLRTREIQC
jgi:hypothetical protein